MHFSDTASHLSKFSVYMTRSDSFGFFGTQAPDGSNAIFSVTGDNQGCEELEVFNPAQFVSPDSIPFKLSEVST